MTDPLADVVLLLRPRAPFSKTVEGRGRWRVRRGEDRRPFYAAIVEGATRLCVEGREPVDLDAGDFVLIPEAPDFTMASRMPPPEGVETLPTRSPAGVYRLGDGEGPPDVRLLVGYCRFDAPDAALLVPLLPDLVVVRGEAALATLVGLVGEEARRSRPARDLVLERLLEVLLIEALRSTTGPATATGLVRGLADARLAVALRRVHEAPERAWTVAEMAREAALSRSTFFERFTRTVGVAPMEYLLTWRMALAKDLLRRRAARITEVAARVGYASVSAFSVAFTRHVGRSPVRWLRQVGEPGEGADDAAVAPLA